MTTGITFDRATGFSDPVAAGRTREPKQRRASRFRGRHPFRCRSIGRHLLVTRSDYQQDGRRDQTRSRKCSSRKDDVRLAGGGSILLRSRASTPKLSPCHFKLCFTTVFILATDSSVRWTGHLPAISAILPQNSSETSPSMEMTRSNWSIRALPLRS